MAFDRSYGTVAGMGPRVDVVGLRRCSICGRLITDDDVAEVEHRRLDEGKPAERSRRAENAARLELVDAGRRRNLLTVRF